MRGGKNIIVGALAMLAFAQNTQAQPGHPKLKLGQKAYIKGKNGKRFLKK